jgi:hypothetical protein
MNPNSNLNMRINSKEHSMRANEAFPSKYLKSSDVKDRPRVAVISHIERETIGEGKDA